ncbi:MAG: hypothetical protein NZ898_17205, partial [Myxococcota bacterium]|nr:hypothetical protein [Myxococcota bacterium]
MHLAQRRLGLHRSVGLGRLGISFAALLGALRVEDRRALHARIATALERDGAATDERRIAELAHHTAC